MQKITSQRRAQWVLTVNDKRSTQRMSSVVTVNAPLPERTVVSIVHCFHNSVIDVIYHSSVLHHRLSRLLNYSAIFDHTS